MKKNYKSGIAITTLILIIATVAVGGLYLFSKKQTSQVKENQKTVSNQNYVKNNNIIPNPNSTSSKNITLGKEFIAHKGEKFVVDGSYGDIFEITDFYNVGPCPTGANCFLMSGQAVFYQIKTADSPYGNKGRLYNSQLEEDLKIMPYSVFVNGSDYETYARIVLQIQGKNQ